MNIFIGLIILAIMGYLLKRNPSFIYSFFGFIGGMFFTSWFLYAFSQNNFWEVLPTIVFTATGIFIAIQAFATLKLANAQNVPKLSFSLISEPTNESRDSKEKWGTRLIIWNHSDFIVWVWTKIDIKVNGSSLDKSLAGKRFSGEMPWQLSPHGMVGNNPHDEAYKFLFKIFSEHKENFSNIKITADISYFASMVKSELGKKQEFEWISLMGYTFNTKEYEWENDLRISERGLFYRNIPSR